MAGHRDSAEEPGRDRGQAPAAGACTLEQELIGIFASASRPRNREIVIGYYGWADGRRHTLAEIGARYGVTRERTRQICAKLVRRPAPGRIPAPVMDRTLDFVQRRLPSSVEVVEAQLVQLGLTAVGLGLEHVDVAARLLGRAVPFCLVPVGAGRLAVRPDQAVVPAAVVEAARKDVYYRGLGHVRQIAETVSGRFPERVDHAIVAETLQLVSGFAWLDRPSGWFRFSMASKHGLPRLIEKVLAVSGRIRLNDLQAALARRRRSGKTPIPEGVLREYCRHLPGIRLEGPWVLADPPRSWEQVLTGVEARLVKLLKQHGPIMERGALEELCMAEGMNRFSFDAFLANSPVIVQYGHSVYGLAGSEAHSVDVQLLAARHRAQRASGKVLEGHGRTPEGRLWLRYRLSKAASTYAVVTIPAALKTVICGKFALEAADGRPWGTLAAREGRAWGLGRFLRTAGAKVHGRMQLTFDLHQRKAVVSLESGEWIVDGG